MSQPIKPALILNIQETEPLDEVNHSTRPAGSRAALMSVRCDKCETEGSSVDTSHEIPDLHLQEIGAEFTLSDVPTVCNPCSQEYGYTDVTNLRAADLDNVSLDA